MKDVEGADLLYKRFPKGDARRYLLVLLTIHRLRDTETTLQSVAMAIDATRAEVSRAIAKLTIEFGVVLRQVPTERRALQYTIDHWGIVNRSAALDLLTGKRIGAVVDAEGKETPLQ